MSSYLGKFNYSANITRLTDYFNVSYSEAGLVTTMFFFAYGAGQFVNGVLCKKYNNRLVIFGVLVLSAAINLSITFVTRFFIVKYAWLLNGMVLSALWPTISGAMLKSIDKSMRRLSMYFMTVSTPTGVLVTYALSSLFALTDSLWLAFYVAAAVLVAVAFCWVCFYGKIIKQSNMVESECEEKEEVRMEKADKAYIATSSFVLIVMFVMIVTAARQFTRDGLTTWTPSILKNTFDTGDALSIITSVVLPLVAIAAPFAVNLLNKGVKSLFLRILLPIVGAIIFCVLIIATLGLKSLPLSIVLFIAVYYLLTVSEGVGSSTLPMLLSSRIDEGLTSGFINGFGYIGGAVSTYLLGWVADVYGWAQIFYVMIAMLTSATLFGFAVLLFKKDVRSMK